MIKTFTGPMHSGKTAEMINCYNKIWNKEHIKCFKPKCDTRELGYIKSKDLVQSIDAICIEKFEEILDYIDRKTVNIFIDEAQMIQGNVNVLTYLSISKDIDIYLAGLNMTSEQIPFLTMPQILAISDEVINIHASCFDCGRPASYTYYEGNKKKDILVGDKGYLPLCAKCLKKRRSSTKLKNLITENDKK